MAVDKHALYGGLIGAIIGALTIIISLISSGASKYLFGGNLELGIGSLYIILIPAIIGAIIGWIVGIVTKSENRENKAIPTLTLSLSLLCAYVYLLILGWTNYLGVGNSISIYGDVKFVGYLFMSIIASIIPFLIIIHFNRKIDTNQTGILSRYSLYKYALLVIYVILAVVVSGIFGSIFGLIYVALYLTILIPLIIVIDISTICQKYISGYKKIIPLVLLFVILLSTFAVIYAPSPKSGLGACAIEDTNCIDLSFAEKAFEKNDPKICHNAPIPERCFLMLSSISHDSSICEFIDPSKKGTFSRGGCYSDLYNSECMLMQEDNAKKECLRKQCEQITNNTESLCFTSIESNINDFNKYGWGSDN